MNPEVAISIIALVLSGVSFWISLRSETINRKIILSEKKSEFVEVYTKGRTIFMQLSSLYESKMLAMSLSGEILPANDAAQSANVFDGWIRHIDKAGEEVDKIDFSNRDFDALVAQIGEKIGILKGVTSTEVIEAIRWESDQSIAQAHGRKPEPPPLTT